MKLKQLYLMAFQRSYFSPRSSIAIKARVGSPNAALNPDAIALLRWYPENKVAQFATGGDNPFGIH